MDIKTGQQRYELVFGGQTHILYQHSYLGYGLMEARRRVKQANVKQHIQNDPEHHNPIYNVCVRQGFSDRVTMADGEIIETMGSAEGFSSCHRLVQKELFNTACPVQPCAFDGVYQPRLTDAFPDADIYAFSYIYDRLEPLGIKESFQVQDIEALVDRVCRGQVEKAAMDEWHSNANYCLDTAYIYALLRDGYQLEGSRWVRTARRLNGVETSWCVGAALAILDQGNFCHF